MIERKEKLTEKQARFALMIARFIVQVNEIPGYAVTFGEAYRTKEMAAIYDRQGKGISNSLHTLRLAVDLNLFINGDYKTDTEAYTDLGILWESMGGVWGGRFEGRPDGNHFSLEHEGVK